MGSTRGTGTTSAAQAADAGRMLDELVSGGGDVAGRSLGGTAAKSAADLKKNPVGQAADEVRVLKDLNGDRGGVVVDRSLSGTVAKSAADFKNNPVGQAVEEVRVLKEKNGDGATRMTRKPRQRLKRKMKGGS